MGPCMVPWDFYLELLKINNWIQFDSYLVCFEKKSKTQYSEYVHNPHIAFM